MKETPDGLMQTFFFTGLFFFCFRQFEYQQAQLELEIENLSWKLERDELYCRGVSTLRRLKNPVTLFH